MLLVVNYLLVKPAYILVFRRLYTVYDGVDAS